MRKVDKDMVDMNEIAVSVIDDLGNCWLRFTSIAHFEGNTTERRGNPTHELQRLG